MAAVENFAFLHFFHFAILQILQICTGKTVKIKQNTGFLHTPRVATDASRRFASNGGILLPITQVFAKNGRRNCQIPDDVTAHRPMAIDRTKVELFVVSMRTID